MCRLGTAAGNTCVQEAMAALTCGNACTASDIMPAMASCYPAVEKGKCTVTEATAVKAGFDGTDEELQAAIATLSDDCMVCASTSMMAAGTREAPNEADVDACAAEAVAAKASSAITAGPLAALVALVAMQ